MEIVRPPPVKLEIIVDLRRRTFELGGGIDAVIAITPKRDAVHVEECRVALILEYEYGRVTTTFDRRGGSAFSTTGLDKSVDVHEFANAVIISKQDIPPARTTCPAQFTVPDKLPRPPDGATASTAAWKLVATLELNDGGVFRAEREVTVRG